MITKKAAFKDQVINDISLYVIEHNLDVIKSADWLIDIGSEGGFGGGQIVGEGTPEDISETEESHTGRFLKDVL